MAIPTFTKTGTKSPTAATLPKEVFGVEVGSHDLLKQAYEQYLANRRTNNAVTLKRGEVSGGGKKPWRQKGTGRARTGSIRNPIWRGGGITFGPTGIENYTKKMTKKAKRLAIRQALSLASQNDHVIVIENFEVTSGKTADAKKLLDKIGAKGRILLVGDKKHEATERSVRNLSDVAFVAPGYTSVFTILNADTVVITKPALETLKTWLGDKS